MDYLVSFAGLSGSVQTIAGLTEAVPEGAQLHEADPIAQVPRGVRTGEGDQGGQSVVGVVRKVSKRYE